MSQLFYICFWNIFRQVKFREERLFPLVSALCKTVHPGQLLHPYKLDLGVQMHHRFGSKLLTDTLNSLGFCSSYSEVQRFELSATQHRNIELEKNHDSQVVQIIADNVDTWRVQHVPWYGYHCLDDTRYWSGQNCTKSICFQSGSYNLRQNKHFILQPEQKHVWWTFFHNLADLSSVHDSTANMEFLLKITKPLCYKMPSWSGFMQAVQRGSNPGMSSVIFLPMIDLNPSDLTCIYPTLRFVTEQTSKLNVLPVVTLDQPVYWKALQIVSSASQDSHIKSIVLRLGAFSTEMSFLGCIGQLMENTGLEELIEIVYASNSVGHMLNGKSVVSRRTSFARTAYAGESRLQHGRRRITSFVPFFSRYQKPAYA